MNEVKELDLLGKTCRDIVSEYEGICTSVVEYMYGCEQYTLRSKSKNNEKGTAHYFFRGQLEIVDDGITDKVKVPEYSEPKLFGKECVDKVTGTRGLCVGRLISLFNCDQLVLELMSSDLSSEPKVVWIDEGRVELASEPEIEINPENVIGSRPGGLCDVWDYPQVNHAKTIVI